MAGTYTEGQSKVLSGVYTLIQKAVASLALGQRGIVAYPFTADWGPVNELKTVIGSEAFAAAYNADGASLTAGKIFMHGFKGKPSRVLAYRMATDDAAKASVTLEDETPATAMVIETLYPTDRVFTAVVKAGVTSGKIIEILEGSQKLLSVSGDTVEALKTALDASDYVRVTTADALPADTAGEEFAGGDNGEVATNTEYVAFLDEVEADGRANAVAFDGVDDEDILEVGEDWVERVRGEGVYTTFVRGGDYADLDAANTQSKAMNYRGIVNVGNTPETGVSIADAAIFVAARVASVALNSSLADEVVDYEGVPTKLKRSERIDAKQAGTIVFVQDGELVRMDEGVNTLTDPAAGESVEFGKIRINNALDHIARDLEQFGMEYKKGRSNTTEARQTFAATVEGDYLAPLVAQDVIQPGFFYEPDPDYHGPDATNTPAIDEAFFHSDITPVDSKERIYQKIGVSF